MAHDILDLKYGIPPEKSNLGYGNYELYIITMMKNKTKNYFYSENYSYSL